MKELQLYKMYVAKPLESGSLTSSVDYGFMTNKPVSGEDLLAINQYYSARKSGLKCLGLTLFTKDELVNVSLMNKVYKQLLHYISGGNYGTQTFEFEGKKFTFDIVNIVTKEELFEAIKKDIYASKPLSEEKLEGITEIINKFNFKVDYSKVKNNEFKVSFIRSHNSKNTTNSPAKLEGVTGDDVLRTIINIVTGSSLLIKSKSVIKSLSEYKYNAEISDLMFRYKSELSQVFNRHKVLFLTIKKSAKNSYDTSLINQISKLSKTTHVPIKPALNKIFISKYSKYNSDVITPSEVAIMLQDLARLTVVDKMKLINCLEVHASNMEKRVFIVRNGKAWISDEKSKLSKKNHKFIYGSILASLVNDLSHLKGKTIKYPTNIDYGFPISEKKSVDNLPFGTTISATGSKKYLVAGMYWKNSWGSRDLDLSSVSINGDRTGWGQINSYAREVLFSGDITNAPNGAIEYLANKSETPVVLINNIFSGNEGSKFKIVVGETSAISHKYVENAFVELECKFSGTCKNMTIGALYKDKFILYPLAVGNNSVSSKKDKAILPFMLVEHMNLKELLTMAGANVFDSCHPVQDGSVFDIDLSIENVTFDKLSNILVDDKELSKV